MAKEITSANFETEVLKSSLPVVVDFWAPWCGPCKAIAPSIDVLSGEMKGSVEFGKVNIDDHPDIAGRYGIMSIPTLLIFRGGNVTGQLVGALPKEELEKRIKATLENA